MVALRSISSSASTTTATAAAVVLLALSTTATLAAAVAPDSSSSSLDSVPRGANEEEEERGLSRFLTEKIFPIDDDIVDIAKKKVALKTSHLQVHVPHALYKDNGGYNHNEALFGMPQYGGSIVENVHYAGGDFCRGRFHTPDDKKKDDKNGDDDDKTDDKDGKDGGDGGSGRNMRKDWKKDWGDGNDYRGWGMWRGGNGRHHNKKSPWDPPYILMIDRGGCSFVQKVRNAQKAGAVGVLLADTTCLCSDGDTCTSAAGPDVCQSSLPIVTPDGDGDNTNNNYGFNTQEDTGDDIHIPTFLLSKLDSDTIKAELYANHPVQVEMKWSLPSPDDRVEYDLWTIPTDDVAKDFTQTFKTTAQALGKHAYFTPHQYIYDGTATNCRGTDDPHEHGACYGLCTNAGRYCAVDPDGDVMHGASGADVVTESLRRICIWKRYGETDGIGKEWWEYVSAFDKCDGNVMEKFGHGKGGHNHDVKCVAAGYKAANIDSTMVDGCMHDSGGLDRDAPNAFLDLELAAETKRGVVVLPTAYVNKVPLGGSLTSTNVFGAVCAGFADGTAPEVCRHCANCAEDVQGCIDNGGRCSGGSGGGGHFFSSKGGSGGGGGISVRMFVLSLLGVGGFLYYQYRKTREEMRDEVKAILSQYMPLGGGGEEEGGGGGMDLGHRQGGSDQLLSSEEGPRISSF